MKFSRSDYNGRIVDLDNKIPEDEPVFLLRAQDQLAPKLLLKWATAVRLSGGDPLMARAAEDQAQSMIEWQQSHGCKTPDSYRESSEMQYLKSKLESVIESIKTTPNYVVDFMTLKNDCEAYYGKESLLILMPMDLAVSESEIDESNLKFDDFKWNEEDRRLAYKAKIILYCNRFKHAFILKSTL